MEVARTLGLGEICDFFSFRWALLFPRVALYPVGFDMSQRQKEPHFPISYPPMVSDPITAHHSVSPEQLSENSHEAHKSPSKY